MPFPTTDAHLNICLFLGPLKGGMGEESTWGYGGGIFFQPTLATSFPILTGDLNAHHIR